MIARSDKIKKNIMLKGPEKDQGAQATARLECCILQHSEEVAGITESAKERKNKQITELKTYCTFHPFQQLLFRNTYNFTYPFT